MKNTKITKFLVAALSLALLLAAAFSISALADGETATPEIVSKNVKYGDKLYFMFAVPTENGTFTAENTKVTLYTGDPASADTNNYSYTATESYAVNGKECLIFTTGGVPYRDVAKYVYAEAVYTVGTEETKSALVRYSMLEYFYERLYTCDNSPSQIKLYNTSIDHACAVQQVTIFDENLEATNIKDYKYVYIDKTLGTLDGTNYSGIFANGETVTPIFKDAEKPVGYYGVTNVASDGTKTLTKLRKAEVATDKHSIITPYTFTGGETFENITHGFANNTAAGTVTLTDNSKISAWLAYKEGVSDNGFGITTDPQNSANKVFAFRRNSLDETKTATTAQLYVESSTSDSNFNAIVFQAELCFDRYDGYTDWINLYFAKNWGDASITSAYQLLRFGTSNDNVTLQHYGSSESAKDIGVANGEWFNLRVEYYILDATAGIVRTEIYINNELFERSNYVSSTPVPTDIVRMVVAGNSGAFFNMYMDDMSFSKVRKDFKQPVTDFEDGTKIPSNISTSGNNISKNVENGELVINTSTSDRSYITFRPTESYANSGNETFNTWVYETDITLSSVSSANARLVISGGGKSYQLTVGGINNTGSNIYFQNYNGGSGTVSGNNSIHGAEMCHFRMEYYVDASGNPCIDIYINGIKVGKTITHTTVEEPAISEVTSVYFDIEQQAIDFTFDNVQFYPTYIER